MASRRAVSEAPAPRGEPLRHSHAAWARGAWLATTLALGVALIAASWANFRAARAASDALNRGQIEILQSSVRHALWQSGPGNEDTALSEVLEAQQAGGLRYVALLDPAGTVAASAGEPLAPVALPAVFGASARAAGIVMVAVDGRIRAFLPRPLRGPAAADRGGDAESSGRPLIGHTVIEFEPVLASGLEAQALRSLAIGSLAAALLTLAALGFWRQSVRYEAAQRQMEQQRRLSQLGEMSAVLAHEIRNPLASLKGNAQLLAERLAPDTKERRRAERVVGEATRIEALTTDLLDFARSAPLDRRPVDPVELLRDAAADADEPPVEIDAAGAPALWPLDAMSLRRALVNLLRNAWQVSPVDRPPVARVAEEEGRLVITLRDSGPGLAEADRERIFDPFYTTRAQGTGLGLPVARRIVEQHGGTLRADNDPGGGAVFRVVLPRTHEGDEDGERSDRR